MNKSIRTCSAPIGAKGESIPSDQLVTRIARLKKELWLQIPEPQRNDIVHRFELLPADDQLHLVMYYEAAPQPELPLDGHHAQPILEALVDEVQALPGRIESSMTDIYARIEDPSAPPLTARQDELLRKCGGKGQSLSLVTGPLNIHIPYGPAPVTTEPRVFDAQVSSHQPNRLEVHKIYEEAEGGQRLPVRSCRGKIPLLLNRAGLEEQARLHRQVAEIFIKSEPYRIRFQASAKVSATTGLITQLLFERTVQ